MSDKWQQQVTKNFKNAAPFYEEEAKLQSLIAERLAKICSKHEIRRGLWIDLGSGTGLLAKSLEKETPDQAVMRIDNAEEMLAQDYAKSNWKHWDLNNGVPPLSEKPQLLASSFALHWLNNPAARLEEWVKELAPGGWIALATPIKGSFQEWHHAAAKAKVPCTAISLPTQISLMRALKTMRIHYQEIHVYKESSTNLKSLFKPIINVGAQTTKTGSLTVSQWKRLKMFWPRSRKSSKINLTWLTQLLIVQK